MKFYFKVKNYCWLVTTGSNIVSRMGPWREYLQSHRYPYIHIHIDNTEWTQQVKQIRKKGEIVRVQRQEVGGRNYKERIQGDFGGNTLYICIKILNNTQKTKLHTSNKPMSLPLNQSLSSIAIKPDLLGENTWERKTFQYLMRS